MEKIVNSTEETKDLARELAERVEPNQILALYGNLGSGKTTFTRFLVRSLGFKNKVQSPSFVLSRIYKKKDPKKRGKKENDEINQIKHLDFYRLVSHEEISDLGPQELLDPDGGIIIIEWPEMVEEHLKDKEVIKIYFTDLGNEKRKIEIHNLH